MPKKSKLKDMKSTDGKLWGTGKKSVGKIISEQDNFYTVKSAEQYESELKKMNLLDLQAHASSVYVTPRDNRDSLIRQLVSEFQIKKLKYSTST